MRCAPEIEKNIEGGGTCGAQELWPKLKRERRLEGGLIEDRSRPNTKIDHFLKKIAKIERER